MRPDLTIVATGDLHVDERLGLAGLHPVDPKTREPLVLAQGRRMMRWIGQVAADAGADLILHGGDQFDNDHPSPAALAVAFEELATWCEVCHVVADLGNHERSHGIRAHALEPLKSLRPGRLRVLDGPAPYRTDRIGRVPGVAIFPVPYPSRSYIGAETAGPMQTNVAIAEALDRVITAHACEARTLDIPTVQLGHGSLRGAAYNEYQRALYETDILISTDLFDAFDVAVWSHLHKRQRAPGCVWSGSHMEFTHGFVGSCDRKDFGEALDPKGVSVLRLIDDRWSCEFVRYPYARQFCSLDLGEVEEHEDEIRREVGGDVPRIYQVVGEVPEPDYERASTLVRALKNAGVIIANRCTVARPDRARVADVRAELGAAGVLDAVFQARPDLGARADTIRANVAQLAGGAA
jgi:DNA repair exonuclease SbcCD nuclease subunit